MVIRLKPGTAKTKTLKRDETGFDKRGRSYTVSSTRVNNVPYQCLIDQKYYLREPEDDAETVTTPLEPGVGFF